MKKLILAVTLALSVLTAQSSEFTCIMEKASYVHDVTQLIPALIASKNDHKAMKRLEDSLTPSAKDILNECDDVTTGKQLKWTVKELAAGAVQAYRYRHGKIETPITSSDEFICTMEKAGYIGALTPLVPLYIKAHKESDMRGLKRLDKRMKESVAGIYESCDDIQNADQLKAAILPLAEGTHALARGEIY